MNKQKFIEKLKETTSYNEDQCIIINEVLESHLIIGKKGQEKIISDFETKLGINREDALSLYNTCVSILGRQMKNKLRHPFKSKEKES
ncbi:MAG: hypothetical protein IKH36_03145 [Bacilli bacterium]|nr:hypothetical protein [Bacilli bacterium]